MTHYGAHVSISGGFDKSIDRISALGGNTLMTFASSPRSLQTRPFSPAEIQNYLTKKSASGIIHHFLHGVYLVNLATPDPAYLQASIDSLIYYQQLLAEIGGSGTIFHIGSHKGRGLSQTLDQIVAAVNFILDSSPKNTKLIIENAAGQEDTVGSNFSELAEIISRVGDKPKIGICLDTQHAFAAGYSLDTVLLKFDRVIGIKRLIAVHLNDSLTEFGSHVDRHANLGEGLIGLENLQKFAREPQLKDIPFILEVPGENHSGPRKQDIDVLKSLFN